MDERTMSYGTAVTVALWLWVVSLLTAAWVTFLAGGTWVPLLLGLTACASSAAAAVAHIRCYVMRVCALVRVTNGLVRTPESSELRPIR